MIRDKIKIRILTVTVCILIFIIGCGIALNKKSYSYNFNDIIQKEQIDELLEVEVLQDDKLLIVYFNDSEVLSAAVIEQSGVIGETVLGIAHIYITRDLIEKTWGELRVHINDCTTRDIDYSIVLCGTYDTDISRIEYSGKDCIFLTEVDGLKIFYLFESYQVIDQGGRNYSLFDEEGRIIEHLY